MLTKLDRIWVFTILFMNGWYFTLPVTDQAMPLLLTPVQVVHGVFLHEFLLIAYILFQLMMHRGRMRIGSPNVRSLGLLIAALGCLGVISTGVNLQPMRELAGACRYFLFALYFLLATVWGEKYSPVNILQSLLLGIASAGAINIYYTFKFAFVQLAGVPLLLGQNGPGGYLGLSVLLSAWLMLERRNVMHALTAVFTATIGFFAASISYSKLSMLMAALGVIAWGGLFLSSLVSKRSRRISAIILCGSISLLISERAIVVKYLDAVDQFITYKFRNMDQRSVGERSQYWYITAEILAKHPLCGVGYGGFYDATLKTETYKNQASADEDPEAGAKGESNPHNSFLYYTSANGFPGLLLSVAMCVVLFRVLWKALAARGLVGELMWVCLLGGYLVFAMTLPTLLNTTVLYLPVAVALVLARETTLLRPQQNRFKGHSLDLATNNPA